MECECIPSVPARSFPSRLLSLVGANFFPFRCLQKRNGKGTKWKINNAGKEKSGIDESSFFFTAGPILLFPFEKKEREGGETKKRRKANAFQKERNGRSITPEMWKEKKRPGREKRGKEAT